MSEALTTPMVKFIEKEHGKQVAQSFYGSLLGQATVLTLYVAVYVSALALLYKVFAEDLSGFRAWIGPALFWPVIVAPLAVVLLFSALPMAVRALHERRLKAATFARKATEAPPFQLHPYGRQDRARFRRPDGAEEKALAWVRAARRPVLYLCGESGAGKSSLLGASLLPALEDAGWATLTVRVDADPVRRLRDALAGADIFDTPPHPNTGLKTLLERAAAAREAAGTPLLLVIDQFEEVLLLNTEEERAPLFEALNAVETAARPGLRVLLAFRSDYRPLLVRFGLPAYDIHDNAFELGAFVRADAEAFLAKSVTLSPDAMARLFRGLDRLEHARGLYRPITLNMVGTVLWRMGTTLDADPSRLIERYLKDTIGRGELRDFAPPVLGSMITPAATKEPRALDGLAEATNLPRWQVEATLSALEGHGLVRPVSPDRTVFEISHDFVARLLAVILGRVRTPWLRRAAPIALPVAALAWIALAAGTVIAWPQIRENIAIAELGELGFEIRRTNDGDIVNLASEADLAQEDLERLGTIAPLLNIRSLTLGHQQSITSLEPLRELSSLTSLSVFSAHDITSLEPLRELTSLTSLKITGAFGVKDLEPLRELPSLTELDLTGIGAERLEPLRRLQSLTSLSLRNTDKITSLGPLRDLSSLTALSLRRARGVTTLEPLGSLASLARLDITATNTTSVEPLRRLAALTYLNVTNANSITTLDPLKGRSVQIVGASPELMATMR